MKTNRFKQLWAEGRSPVGHVLFEFSNRAIAQILEAAGVDFVMIDMEHSSFSIESVAELIGWLKATRVAPFVRVPELQRHLITWALDAGALGIIVPNVQTVAQARALVDAAKYPPRGHRGFYFGGAPYDYRLGDIQEDLTYSNENTTLICLIESPEGVENATAIAATPGIDALWVGYGDLAQYMGIPGEFHHPEFLAAMRRVVEAAHAHGLPAIIQPGNMSQLEEWVGIGFNVISYGADYAIYRDALSAGVAAVHRLLGGA